LMASVSPFLMLIVTIVGDSLFSVSLCNFIFCRSLTYPQDR
jgi:hypothetical protein